MTWIAETLALLLPNEEETWLLRACLLTEAPAREAWDRCRASPERLASARALLPLLAASADANEPRIDPAALAFLRAAALREDLRAGRFRRIAAEALAGLADAGPPVLVTRGAALAATVYRTPSHRHCHDLDLLAADGDVTAAARTLERIGWTGPATRLRHPSGVEAALHATVFDVPYYAAPLDEFARGSESVAIEGAAARVPSAESTLIHVLGHAAYSSSRRRLCWVTDAWHLLVHRADLRWPEVVARLGACGLALPASVMLEYLARLDAPVPPASLAALVQRARAAGRVEEDAAVAGTYRGSGGDWGRLWRAQRSWRGRLGLARWALVPSAGYVRTALAPRRDWLLPLCYLYRPVRYLAGALGGTIRG